MPMFFLAVPVVLHLIAASGGGVPTLDVGASCRVAAAARITDIDRVQACMADEQDAYNQLAKTWQKYGLADRSSCVRSLMNFEPSYTELLTCLEMASNARNLPDELY
jgi:hypothetical protein